MIEDEIDSVMGVVEGDAVLPPDKGEAFAQLQKKRLKMIAEKGFKIGFGDCMRIGEADYAREPAPSLLPKNEAASAKNVEQT